MRSPVLRLLPTRGENSPALVKVFTVALLLLGLTAQAARPLDFDGDGRSDLAVYDPAAGLWYITTMAGDVLAWRLQWGFPGGECWAGDFDGDGATDLGIYDPRTGSWYIRMLNGTVLAAGLNWGFPSGEAVVDDFDGDAADDLGIYDSQNGVWYVRSLAGEVLLAGRQWGYNGCEPLSALRTGLAAPPVVFDDQAVRFFVLDDPSGPAGFGGREGEPLAGDVDGDGVDELGIYVADAGLWTWMEQDGAPDDVFDWGFKGGVPVCGDYDGNGYTDCAIYDCATGHWYIRASSGMVLAAGVSWGGRGLVAVGRRMANPAVDGSALRFGDSSATFNITSITVTDLERGSVYRPSRTATLNLLPGWYEVDINWYGSTGGFINWYRRGNTTRTVTVEPRRAYRATISGGSINAPFYTAPSLAITE